jgi:hypothetical protein
MLGFLLEKREQGGAAAVSFSHDASYDTLVVVAERLHFVGHGDIRFGLSASARSRSIQQINGEVRCYSTMIFS